MQIQPTGPTRRTLLAAAGMAGMAGAGIALTGCAAYGEAQPAGGAAPADGAAGANPADGAGAETGETIANVADIPVAGGKVLEDRKIVVTQPKQGTFQCFSAVCTHAGCLVGDVKGGTINCPCHGSKFKIADGSVAAGPAPKPLAKVAITVDGDAVKLS